MTEKNDFQKMFSFKRYPHTVKIKLVSVNSMHCQINQTYQLKKAHICFAEPHSKIVIILLTLSSL